MKVIAGFVVALATAGVLGSASSTLAQDYANPSLLPLPQINPPQDNYHYPTATENQVAATAYRPGQQPTLRSPSSDPTSPELVPTPAPNPNGNGNGGNAWSDYAPAPNPYEEAMSDNWEGCDALGGCCYGPGPGWFGGVYGLFMRRDMENNVGLTYEVGPQELLLSSRDAETGWQGGAEARFGKWFGCGQWGLEGVYWGMFENSAEANAYSAGTPAGLGTRLTLNNIEGFGTNVREFFENAERHRLQRNFEAHNVELNLLHMPLLNCGPCFDGCGPRLRCVGLLGVRYLRIDEGFGYAESNDGVDFSTPVDDWYYNIDTVNNLVGVQLGLRVDYMATQRIALFADTKFGLFNNYMTLDSGVVNGNGDYGTINNGKYLGENYYVDSNKDDVSFVGELRLGVGYQIRPRWRLTAAYRAVAVTGLALTTNQIPTNFNNLEAANFIDSNASMILHGGQFGLEYNY